MFTAGTKYRHYCKAAQRRSVWCKLILCILMSNPNYCTDSVHSNSVHSIHYVNFKEMCGLNACYFCAQLCHLNKSAKPVSQLIKRVSQSYRWHALNEAKQIFPNSNHQRSVHCTYLSVFKMLHAVVYYFNLLPFSAYCIVQYKSVNAFLRYSNLNCYSCIERFCDMKRVVCFHTSKDSINFEMKKKSRFRCFFCGCNVQSVLMTWSLHKILVCVCLKVFALSVSGSEFQSNCFFFFMFCFIV